MRETATKRSEAQEEFVSAIRAAAKLHSEREIAAAANLSHQRIHQIINEGK